MDVHHPQRIRRECAENGGWRGDAGCNGQSRDRNPLLAAPRVGLTGTAKCAGAFLLHKSLSQRAPLLPVEL